MAKTILQEQQHLLEATRKMEDNVRLQNAAWDVVDAFFSARPIKLVRAILKLKKRLAPWR